MPADPRLQVGGSVEALVKYITSDAAAKRFYGAEWDTARAPGVIVRVEKILPNARSKVRQTIITAKYRLPDGREKDVSMNKRSVVFTNQAPPATSNPTGTSNNTIAGPRSNAVPIQTPPAISNTTGTSNTTVASPTQNPTGPTGASNTTITGAMLTGTSNTITVAGPTPNPTGTSDATITGPRSTVPSLSNVSVINAFNIIAAENPNIAQVAHDCIWEKSIAQDVVVAPDIPALQWYWIDGFADKLYPGSRPFERFSRLQIFYQVFPRDQISLILTLTNEKLAQIRGKKLTEGELIKFFA
jgi:hypothetical protein